MERKKFKKAYAIIILCVLIISGCIIYVWSRTSGSGDKSADKALAVFLSGDNSPRLFPIDHVIDGDTFVVQAFSGKATVRLLGINTPETVDPRKPVECFGPEASARAHALLDDKEVRLVEDRSQDKLDKYGRVLAYAYLPDGLFYNKEMIVEGYAYEYTYGRTYLYGREFKAAETMAKSANLGLWSSKTCNGKK